MSNARIYHDISTGIRIFRVLEELGLRRGIPSQKKFSPEDEVRGDEVGGLDAYKVAVLVSVAAAILSLCL